MHHGPHGSIPIVMNPGMSFVAASLSLGLGATGNMSVSVPASVALAGNYNNIAEDMFGIEVGMHVVITIRDVHFSGHVC